MRSFLDIMSKEQILKILYNNCSPGDRNNIDKDSFFSKNAFDDLELENLEMLIGGWKKRDNNYNSEKYSLEDVQENKPETNPNRWGVSGLGLLNYLLRHPLTKPDQINYMQESVLELTERSKLRTSLTNILIREKGLFRAIRTYCKIENECDRVSAFGNFFNSLEEVTKILDTAESDCLKDLGKSIKRLMKDKNLGIAGNIAVKQDHNFSVVGGKIIRNSWGSYRAHEINYITDEGQEVNVFVIADRDLDRHGNGSFNAYYTIWKAIENSLNKSGLESLENIALNGAILGYLNGLANFAQIYNKNNIKYIFPEIHSNGKKELYFKRALNPLLISKNKVIPNNISFDNNSTVQVIAGANNGGKTTYLKTTGLLTVMAQIGAPIPATEARITPFANIYSHFPKTESVLSGNGRFVDELKRLRLVLENANESTLVLLDEPCAGTSNEDALDVSLDVIYGLQKLGCSTLYSTHLHEIQNRLKDKERYPNCVNMRVEVRGSYEKPIFTHKISKGVAGRSYGATYAKLNLPVDEILKSRGK